MENVRTHTQKQKDNCSRTDKQTFFSAFASKFSDAIFAIVVSFKNDLNLMQT